MKRNLFAKYILVNKKPVVEKNLLKWAYWFENSFANDERRVAFDGLEDGRYISTVFLSIDHGFDGKRPMLFETAVISPDGDCDIVERYSTWAGAEGGHKRILEKLKNQTDEKANTPSSEKG